MLNVEEVRIMQLVFAYFVARFVIFAIKELLAVVVSAVERVRCMDLTVFNNAGIMKLARKSF